MANLQAGPALFRFFPINSYTTGVFDIANAQQLEDASFQVETGVFELKSQRTFVSEKDIQTGKDVTIEISVADIGNIPLLATALATDVIGTGDDESIVVKDDSGLEFPYRRLLILPYAGASVTSDRRRWVFCPQVQLRANVNLTFGLETQQAFTITVMPKADPANDIKFCTGNQIFTLYPNVPVPQNTSSTPSTPTPSTPTPSTPTPAGNTRVNGLAGSAANSTTTTGGTSPITFTATSASSYITFNSFTSSGSTPISQSIFYQGNQVALLDYFDGALGTNIQMTIAEASQTKTITLANRDTNFLTNAAN